MRISYWNIKLGQEEINKISNSIENRCLSQGMVTEEFEKNFSKLLEVPYAVATSNGSSALLLTLLSLGIGCGDEVLVPDITFIATAHAVLLTGAKVKFVDVMKHSPIMNVEKVEEKITEKTKAILPVHLNGEAVDITKLKKIAAKYNLLIIEDACQAAFSKNEEGFLGTLSNAGCFSFSVAKLITTAQGGMIVTKDRHLYETLKLKRTHGLKTTFEMEEYLQPGFNFRLTDIHSSIGIEQLKKLPQKIKHMKQIYEIYKNGIKTNEYLRFCGLADENKAIPLYLKVFTEYRNELKSFLDIHGIETRLCAPCLHNAKYFENYNFNFPDSDYLQKRLLYLPTGPDQPLKNVEEVVKIINTFKK